MNEDEKNESGKSQALTMAVTLAMLSVSVGVDIQKVWAESGSAGTAQPVIDRAAVKHDALQQKHDALQQKLDATQQKLRPSIQHKIPAVQQKDLPVRPGVKPIDPPRP